ncbi:MaoC family dehydratase N-terminal domain-containing protein [Bradyrhizobium sp. ma5]|uniref:FAS1-like dehydratase domain-containing protein n=1 Tax=Bradyrhizobium sp. ma5 TaxID=3344828 RepID=UPI0035D4573C
MRKLDASIVGRSCPVTRIRVEAAQLMMFLNSVGADESIFHDLNLVESAGFRRAPIPAEYLFVLHRLSAKEPDECWLQLGIEDDRVEPRAQTCTYFAQISVGDVLTFTTRIVSVMDSESGDTTSVTQLVEVENQGNVHVADMLLDFAVRNPPPEVLIN